MATRVIITTRRGPYLGRVGTLIPCEHTYVSGERTDPQYRSIRLDGDDRPRAFRPDEYTRTT